MTTELKKFKSELDLFLALHFYTGVSANDIVIISQEFVEKYEKLSHIETLRTMLIKKKKSHRS